MTKAEYAKYEGKVAFFFEHEGINNLSRGRITCSVCNSDLHESGLCDDKCPDCGEDCESMDEGNFSYRDCECCGRSGGTLYPASGYCPPEGGGAGGDCLEYEVCDDCLYYATYGQLDDTTMMDMED
jgi:hypothetical protein